MPYSQSVAVRCKLEDVKLAEAFSGRLAVSVMIGNSCPSRDDPLKEYSMFFLNKLNTQEFLFCALK